MAALIPILMDLCVVFFDLLIFTRMITLKRDSRRTRLLMYGGCAVILCCYFLCTYWWEWPASIASAVCMTLPSLILFFVLSKYKDARFFLTFCFVDSCTLIIAFLGRYIGVLTGDIGNIAALLFIFAAFLTVYLVGRPYFSRYHELLEYVDAGWRSMMVSSILIYASLIFLAAYPRPLIERLEYAPVYLLFSAVVLSCYAVFITSALKTSKIYEQSCQLQKEKKWHRIAYVDALTGVANRTAYIEKINDIERTRHADTAICVFVIDIDRFKAVNDSYGHNAGDTVLQITASLLTDTFAGESYSVFRIGGDEFAVIAENIEEEEALNKLRILESTVEKQRGGIPFSVSVGYAGIDRGQNNAVENAFAAADKQMYWHKREKVRQQGMPAEPADVTKDCKE